MLISWNTTRRCNLECLHCYRDAKACADPDELSTDEGRALIEDIASAGFFLLILSGGEPMLRHDIYDLVRHAKTSGLRPVLGSNGTLITADAARQLKEAGAARIGISLDSAHRDAHEHLRQAPGCFDETLAGMAHCREAGLPFQVHTTVTRANFGEIEAIGHKAVELGAVAYHVFYMVPAGRAGDMDDTHLSAEDYEDLLTRIMTLQKELPIEMKPTCAPQFMRMAKQMDMPMRFTKGCLAGTAYACVLPNGDVHPCPYLPIRVGNVRETPFSRLWAEDPTLLRLRHENPGGRCGACGYQSICGGCRARAYFHSDGDYMAEEPWCPHEPTARPGGQA